MKNCNWEIIETFVLPSEYKRFVMWIESQVDIGLVVELEVKKPTNGWSSYCLERHFKCLESQEVWVLTEPDIPARGSWEPLLLQETRNTGQS